MHNEKKKTGRNAFKIVALLIVPVLLIALVMPFTVAFDIGAIVAKPLMKIEDILRKKYLFHTSADLGK